MESEEFTLTDQEKDLLLAAARETITARLQKRRPDLPDSSDLPEHLSAPCGAFVTLHSQGNLRGCIGMMDSDDPLWQTIQEMALSAAFKDPRFPALEAGELPVIDLEISVLTPLKRTTDPDLIEVGKHGIYMKQGFRSGVLLPQVATEQGWDLKTFLTHTCRKAGLDGNAWKNPETEIYTFSALVFGEKSD